MGHSPPTVATPLMPRHSEVINYVYESLSWNANDFHGFRFVMRYPPMPCSVVLQHDLAAPN